MCVCLCVSVYLFTVVCFICIQHLRELPSLINWRSENVRFYTQFNELLADGCLQTKYKAGILKWRRRGRGAEIILMYIQNPKSLPPLNSVFLLSIPKHYNFIISIQLFASSVAQTSQTLTRSRWEKFLFKMCN